MVAININSQTPQSTKPMRQRNASTTTKIIGVLLLCSIALNVSLLQDDYYSIAKETIQFQSFQRHLSTEKGFHPVYVYSNAKIAQGEIPKRSSITRNPGGDYAYSQVNQDYIILSLMRANAAKDPTSKSHSPFFLDLAANDALKLSNTLYLEQNGWDKYSIASTPHTFIHF